MTRAIMIYMVKENDFTVIEGEHIADSLGWDEMIGCVTDLTHRFKGHPYARYMRSPEDWDRWQDRYMRRPPINEVR